MKLVYIILLASLLLGKVVAQNMLPLKDTLIERDGFQIEYKVFEHAVFMTSYKNGKWNGPYKAYYRNGNVWSESNRVNGMLEGKSISYIPTGEIAMIDEWSNGVLKSKKIFYQNTITEPQKYFFVSKVGFDIVKDGLQIKLDSTTPDSIIEEDPYGAYIWLKGQRKLFSGTEAPKYKLIKTGKKTGLYRIDKEGKKTFIRPLTKEEME